MKMAAQKHNILALALALGMGLLTSGVSAVRADELDDIVKARSLKVGIFEDFPPFSSAGTDKLHGYDIDVANALAAATKVKLDLVGITGQNRIPYLNEHKVNILLSVGESAERAKVLDFTDAHAPCYIGCLAPKQSLSKDRRISRASRWR
jgi:polar amino acid transport system substrate-binding protein